MFKLMFRILRYIFVMIYFCKFSAWAAHTHMASPQMRTQAVAQLAKTAGWQAHTLQTSLFQLKAYGSSCFHQNKKNGHDSKILTIYIEGDGLAWLSEDTPSDNPTPLVPTGLKMALRDHTNRPVAYLARPCQFVFNDEWRNCRSEYWTNLRFSVSVIDAMNQAIETLKKNYHAKQIRLIGYSGGGTMATLLAAQRKDVVKLITVAAVLDTALWVRQKSLTPLTGSLNPVDEWKNLASLSQTHWVGGKDKIVPKEIAFAFAQHFPKTQRPSIRVIPEFDHVCCWTTKWPLILKFESEGSALFQIDANDQPK